MKMFKAELVVDAKAMLGEGPCWDHRHHCLYWVDILGKHIHCYDPVTNKSETIDVGQYVGALAVRESGGFIAAMHHGFYFLDIKTGMLTPIHDPEEDLPNNRFNDGKCDPAGRFWAGTMETQPSDPNGALYCMDTHLTTRKLVDNVTISNGLAWSPDSKMMYYIDTPTKEIVLFDYDIDTGQISNKRVAFKLSTEEGAPDGMTIDEEGMLWIAHWGGSQVTRRNPNTGEILAVVSVPATNVTSCVFGGENLDELFITTARVGLDEKALASQPYAGAVFRCKTGVKGKSSYMFKG
jgi:sugar lactone lactonase YvrE